MDSAPTGGASERAVVDREHLRMLSLFHYISGGIGICFAGLMGIYILFYAVFLVFAVTLAETDQRQREAAEMRAAEVRAAELSAAGESAAADIKETPAKKRSGAPPIGFLLAMFAILMLFGGGFFLLFLLHSVAVLYVGWALQKRRHKVLTQVVAATNLLLIPYGTILGVFTLIVVSRESVGRLYAAAEPAHA